MFGNWVTCVIGCVEDCSDNIWCLEAQSDVVKL